MSHQLRAARDRLGAWSPLLGVIAVSLVLAAGRRW
jgi:hypothetical protein